MQSLIAAHRQSSTDSQTQQNPPQSKLKSSIRGALNQIEQSRCCCQGRKTAF
ncbi:hypothetical protein NG798_08845 [Ancylothrix sp. C2]|nr:hypothetical protein [Ancylothrix sp. D3o]